MKRETWHWQNVFLLEAKDDIILNRRLFQILINQELVKNIDSLVLLRDDIVNVSRG